MKNVLAVVLGGGQGSRLFPLTKERSKPAVPIGGKYRLIDIPISNCLNSNINKIFILTQFNSSSLNKHIVHTYRFDNFHRGFVDILAAEQSIESELWYQGTADAVRQNIKHIRSYPEIDYVLILSGDQIYSMDFKEMLDFHIENDNDITIPVIPCTKEEAKSFGIVKLEDNIITDFTEKPKDELTLMDFQTHAKNCSFNKKGDLENYSASMGIYLFKKEVLQRLLKSDYADFGKGLIPAAIKTEKVGRYCFDGYWKDVGTIKTFLEANLEFASRIPEFDFYDHLIYTNARYLPASKILEAKIDESLISEGSIIEKSFIKKSIIGIRSIIKENTTIEHSIIMGADYHDPLDNLGIGKNCVIKNTIVDKNAKVCDNCRIVNINNLDHHDGENYYIREGIVIIPKNAIIHSGTII